MAKNDIHRWREGGRRDYYPKETRNKKRTLSVEQPDWTVVQEIHAIHDQGGKLAEVDITVSKDKITIRREYKMPDRTTRVMKNDYPSIDDLTCRSDMFMLEANQ